MTQRKEQGAAKFKANAQNVKNGFGPKSSRAK